MKPTVLLALAAFTIVAACRPASDAAQSGEAMAQGGAPGAGPKGKSGDPVADEVRNASVPPGAVAQEGVPPGAMSEPRPTSIPARFHGRWGLVEADCTSTRGDAKGLLRIDDNRLTFYESRGTLDRIDGYVPADRFTANYGFSGEGQAWQRVVTLERLPDGRLRRVEEGGEEGPVDLVYSPCPARSSSA